MRSRFCRSRCDRRAMGRRPVVLPHLPHRRAYLFVPYALSTGARHFVERFDDEPRELIDPATFVLRLSGDTPLSRGSRPTLDAGDIITIERPTRANSGPVSSTSTHAVRALRLGPRRLCILAECIRLLSGRCGANLADVRCPGRRGRGFPGRSLRDVHPSRRWCVRSIRSRAWFRRVLHRSWPCA